LSVSFTTLKALDPALIGQLKDTLSEPLFDRLSGSLSIDQKRLKFAEYKIRVLEERLRLVRIEKYGPGTEKLSDAQLELLELEPGVSSAEIQAESERAQLKLSLRTARKHPGCKAAASFSAPTYVCPTLLCRQSHARASMRSSCTSPWEAWSILTVTFAPRPFSCRAIRCGSPGAMSGSWSPASSRTR